MNRFFLDTSYVLALEIADDQYHAKALQHWRTIIHALPLLTTSTYVIDEIVTFFNSREKHAKAVEVGERLMNSAYIQLIDVNSDLFEAGWKYFKRHDDKTYSLTDCISFIIMKNHKISTALTFDIHFSQATYNKIP